MDVYPFCGSVYFGSRWQNGMNLYIFRNSLQYKLPVSYEAGTNCQEFVISAMIRYLLPFLFPHYFESTMSKTKRLWKQRNIS